MNSSAADLYSATRETPSVSSDGRELFATRTLDSIEQRTSERDIVVRFFVAVVVRCCVTKGERGREFCDDKIQGQGEFE